MLMRCPVGNSNLPPSAGMVFTVEPDAVFLIVFLDASRIRFDIPFVNLQQLFNGTDITTT
jgi:hypothetical protein